MTTDSEIAAKLREYEAPCFGYRLVDGVIEKDVFDGGLPEGWFSRPRAAREAAEAPAAPPAPVKMTGGERGAEAAPQRKSAFHMSADELRAEAGRLGIAHEGMKRGALIKAISQVRAE